MAVRTHRLQTRQRAGCNVTISIPSCPHVSTVPYYITCDPYGSDFISGHCSWCCHSDGATPPCNTLEGAITPFLLRFSNCILNEQRRPFPRRVGFLRCKTTTTTTTSFFLLRSELLPSIFGRLPSSPAPGSDLSSFSCEPVVRWARFFSRKP